MTTKDLIDKVITDHLELSLTDGYVTTEWRPRILHWSQIGTLLILGDGTVWSFMGASGTVTLASGTGDLPANFGKFAPNPEGGGCVYVAAAQHELYPKPWNAIMRLRQLSPSSGGQPDFYAVYGRNTTTKRQKIECYPTDNSTLDIFYQRKIPVLVDSTGEDPVSGNLLSTEVPEQYHDVWYQAICDLSGMSGAAPSLASLGPRFQAAFDAMKRECQTGQEGESHNRVGDYGYSSLQNW